MTNVSKITILAIALILVACHVSEAASVSGSSFDDGLNLRVKRKGGGGGGKGGGSGIGSSIAQGAAGAAAGGLLGGILNG